MDIMKIATELFLSKLGNGGSNVDQGIVMTALGALLGGADGKLDLGDLISKFQGGGLMSMAASWLGDGDNEGLDASQLINILGSDAIGGFASKIGVDSDSASAGLAGMIPDLINQASSGGSLLDMAGDLAGGGGVGDILKKLF